METLLAEALIRDVPDFPRPGILFKDITPAVQDPAALRQVVDLLSLYGRERDIQVVVGIEARGFIFGAPVALDLRVGFVPLRKVGKLPSVRLREDYALEYGTSAVEIHEDAIVPGQRVLIIDDLLATGGTAAAAVRLVERLGGVVAGFGFLIELDFLEGRRMLEGYDICSLIHYS